MAARRQRRYRVLQESPGVSRRCSGWPSRWLRSRWAAAVWFWLGRSGTVQPGDSLTALPLTTYPGWEFSPSFSPDGNQVAFAWSKTEGGDDADIYIKQIGGEEPFRLTDNPAPD